MTYIKWETPCPHSSPDLEDYDHNCLAASRWCPLHQPEAPCHTASIEIASQTPSKILKHPIPKHPGFLAWGCWWNEGAGYIFCDSSCAWNHPIPVNFKWPACKVFKLYFGQGTRLELKSLHRSSRIAKIKTSKKVRYGNYIWVNSWKFRDICIYIYIYMYMFTKGLEAPS